MHVHIHTYTYIYMTTSDDSILLIYTRMAILAILVLSMGATGPVGAMISGMDGN